MQILVKQAKSFRNGAQVLTVYPEMSPQTVPDWVREDATFRAGAADGSVQEIQVIPPPPPPPPPTADPEPEPAPDPKPAKKR